MNMAHENGAPDAGLDALAGGNVTPSTMPTERAAPSERTPLAERIIALPPPISMEAFRTKVKVKVAPAAAIVVAKRSTGDDLTRIRGIDAMLAGRLAAIGVSRFAQIATWDQSDVQTISQLLDLGRTISRQNWIEQAALLQGPAKPSVIADAVTPPVETVDVRAATDADAANDANDGSLGSDRGGRARRRGSDPAASSRACARGACISCARTIRPRTSRTNGAAARRGGGQSW
jgi:predicted flap endonuclease-1-like 5' DNA nuclease